jgi:hypothetical protein
MLVGTMYFMNSCTTDALGATAARGAEKALTFGQSSTHRGLVVVFVVGMRVWRGWWSR